MTGITFSCRNDAYSRVCAHLPTGCETADTCCSVPVKLFILTPDMGRFYAPDPWCSSSHLISTCDCTALLIKLLFYESYFREGLCSYTFTMMVAS